MLLDEIVRERFEHSHLPALDMQFEHAHRRLQDFSMAQAEWAASGWRIQEVEQSDIALQLKTELGPVAIHGRFDRLDYHPEEDRWMLLDYKSSDAGLAPEETQIATLIVGGEFWPPKEFSASEQGYDDFDALLTLPAPNDSNF